MRKEALWQDQLQVILRARHRDIEKATLLFDLRCAARGEVGRDAAVNRVENENRSPFLSFRRVDSREDQVIFIQQRPAGLIAGRIRRIERELSEKALARRVGRRNLCKLNKIGLAHDRVVVHAFEVRHIPTADEVKLSRPAGRIAGYQAKGLAKGAPVLSGCRWRVEFTDGLQGIGGPSQSLEQPSRG